MSKPAALIVIALALWSPPLAAQFGAPITTAMANPFGAFVVLDPDGDGDDDLIAGGPTATSPYLQILINDGSANFVYGPVIPAPANTQPADAGDLDGDGDDDVIGTSATALVVVSIQPPFAPVTTYPKPAGWPANALPKLLDFDGDGDLDAVYATQWVQRNAGNAVFGPPEAITLAGLGVTLPPGAGEIFDDWDGDGDQDLFTWMPPFFGAVPPVVSAVRRFRQDCGVLRLADAIGVTTAFGVRPLLCDFDGDGDQDVVALDYAFQGSATTAFLHAFKYDAGRLVSQTSTPAPPVGNGNWLFLGGYAVADIDGDARQDVVFTLYDNGGIGLPNYYFAAAVSVGGSFAITLAPPVTTAVLVGVEGQFVGGPASGRDRIWPGFQTIGGQLLSTVIVRPNNTPQLPVSRRVERVSGARQSAPTSAAWPQPVAVRLTTLAGAPIANQIVTFGSGEGATFSPSSATTDALGIAQTNVTNPQTSGPVHVVANAPLAKPHFLTGVSTGLTAFVETTTPTAMRVIGVDFQYDRDLTPFALAADVPSVPPFPTPFGVVTTSILSPQPSLIILDGLGLFGPPLPGVFTLPNLAMTAQFPYAALVGINMNFQAYAFDATRPFPDSVVVTNTVSIQL